MVGRSIYPTFYYVDGCDCGACRGERAREEAHERAQAAQEADDAAADDAPAETTLDDWTG